MKDEKPHRIRKYWDKKLEKEKKKDTPFRLHHFWYGAVMGLLGWLIPFISGVSPYWGLILFVSGAWVCIDDFVADHFKVNTVISKVHHKLCDKYLWYRIAFCKPKKIKDD
jgi:hypothetical protein